jgi:DNA-binding beta-propeller fold protein YncE
MTSMPRLQPYYGVGLFALLLCAVAIAAGPELRERQASTVAGTGEAGFSGDGGPATGAKLNNPFGVVRGPDGALYVCDMGNHRVRRIGRDGVITTVAGSGQKGYAGDGGAATGAELNEPYEVRLDGAGNMYFVEMRNHVVRKVDAKTGMIFTVAGTGTAGFSGDGGPATRAQLNQPHAIQFSPDGRHLYVCDIANHRLRRVDITTGVIKTFAGDGTRRPTPDGAKVGPPLPLNGPRAIDFDRGGNLWLALREGNAVYRIDMKARTIGHVAGIGKQGSTGNGGPAKEATLSGPKGVAVGPDGNVYLADTESHSVRMIDVKRETIESVAEHFARPHGVFVDGDGAVYVGDSENHRVSVIR